MALKATMMVIAVRNGSDLVLCGNGRTEWQSFIIVMARRERYANDSNGKGSKEWLCLRPSSRLRWATASSRRPRRRHGQGQTGK